VNWLRARVSERSALWSAVLDPLLAVALAGVAVTAAPLTAEATGRIEPLPAALLGIACAAPIAVRRRWPLAVLVAVGGGVLFESWLGLSLNFSGYALMLAVFTVAADSPRRVSLAVLALLPVYLIVADVLYASARAGAPTATLADITTGLLIFVLAWVAGDAVQGRRIRTARLEARAAQLEADQATAASLAVRNERALIARELHDIVAHSVSVMVVQAGAARRVMAERPDEAGAALLSIESTGREALAEMRRLLGVLRTDEAPAPLKPQQGLAGLGGLIAQATSTGMQVELVIEGEPRPLATGVDLAAFRIVQEALTNAIKHAERARTTIRVHYDLDALTIEVVNDGRPAGSGATQAPSAPGAAGLETAGPETGHGLVGMQERVSLYGGDFSAGPRPAGGFAVRARLPLETQSA
jgi:signal transduction histidine kinase